MTEGTEGSQQAAQTTKKAQLEADPDALSGKKGSAAAARKEKSGKLRVLVFQPEGGSPYFVDVKPEEGIFQLKKDELSYHITRGSVWVEGGIHRCMVNAGNPQTINPSTLTGNPVMSPTVLNGIVQNNMVAQVQKYAKTQQPWQQVKTIAMMAVSLIFGVLLFWGIRELGTGFEALQEAIENVRIVVQQGGDGAAAGGGAQSSSHQDIAPGGV